MEYMNRQSIESSIENDVCDDWEVTQLVLNVAMTHSLSESSVSRSNNLKNITFWVLSRLDSIFLIVAGMLRCSCFVALMVL